MKRQMYKIYINESLLILTSSSRKNHYIEKFKPDLRGKYHGKKNSLFNYIDLLEKSKNVKTVMIYGDNFKALKKDFKQLYVTVSAAGGIIVNEYGEILFIFRRKKWDLPKGKKEGKENRKQTAVREVMEETGITNVRLIKKLGVTNHTFTLRSSTRAIKKSHWYLMYALKQKLTPQHEEDIEKAIWMKKALFQKEKKPVYISILDILDKVKDKHLDLVMNEINGK